MRFAYQPPERVILSPSFSVQAKCAMRLSTALQLRSPATMNTSLEFSEWVLHVQDQPCKVEYSDELSQPSLAPSTDSDYSSLEDVSVYSGSRCEVDCCALKKRETPKRRVSFNSDIEVREFAVTVGDHPFCFDGLPLTLDWQHSEEPSFKHIDGSHERNEKYKMPKRLSYEERRDRLFTVSAYSDQRVRNEEINMVINMLQQSWSQPSILPKPDLYEIEEEDEEGEPPKQEEKEQVIHWKRVGLRRSNAFSE